MSISGRIFEILDEKHMTPYAFSKRTGIARSTISDWKTKGTNPAADKILMICRVLDVPPEVLLGGKEKEDGQLPDQKADSAIAAEDMQLLQDYHSLPEPGKKRLKTYMRQLKKVM